MKNVGIKNLNFFDILYKFKNQKKECYEIKCF